MEGQNLQIQQGRRVSKLGQAPNCTSVLTAGKCMSRLTRTSVPDAKPRLRLWLDHGDIEDWGRRAGCFNLCISQSSTDSRGVVRSNAAAQRARINHAASPVREGSAGLSRTNPTSKHCCRSSRGTASRWSDRPWTARQSDSYEHDGHRR